MLLPAVLDGPHRHGAAIFARSRPDTLSKIKLGRCKKGLAGPTPNHIRCASFRLRGGPKRAIRSHAGSKRGKLMGDDRLPPQREAEPTGVDPTGGLEVFEIAGTIKWFDISKGYGFIVPDNGLADVLL